MELGVLDNIRGLEFLKDLDLSSIFSGIGSIIVFLLMVGSIAGILIFTLLFIKKKLRLNQTLHFFEEVNGELIPIEDCKAEELTIPQTTIRVFYIPSKDLYMPRGTRKMGKSSYWYAIRNNREIVNFTLKNINKEMSEANLDYDHTDMRYAYSNLSELIKRNYKDKSTKWWQTYKNEISIIIYVFIFTMAFYFLISKIGGLIDALTPLIERLADALDRIATLERTCGGSISGIKGA